MTKILFLIDRDLATKYWRRERDSKPLGNVNSTTCSGTDGRFRHGKQRKAVLTDCERIVRKLNLTTLLGVPQRLPSYIAVLSL